jgi:hypothetical protein
MITAYRWVLRLKVRVERMECGDNAVSKRQRDRRVERRRPQRLARRRPAPAFCRGGEDAAGPAAGTAAFLRSAAPPPLSNRVWRLQRSWRVLKKRRRLCFPIGPPASRRLTRVRVSRRDGSGPQF